MRNWRQHQNATRRVANHCRYFLRIEEQDRYIDLAFYHCRLNLNETNPEKKVEEFVSFLPVLAYDGSSMKQIDAARILDMAKRKDRERHE